MKNLSALNERWKNIDDQNDPKWNVFFEMLNSEYFNKRKKMNWANSLFLLNLPTLLIID